MDTGLLIVLTLFVYLPLGGTVYLLAKVVFTHSGMLLDQLNKPEDWSGLKVIASSVAIFLIVADLTIITKYLAAPDQSSETLKLLFFTAGMPLLGVLYALTVGLGKSSEASNLHPGKLIAALFGKKEKGLDNFGCTLWVIIAMVTFIFLLFR